MKRFTLILSIVVISLMSVGFANAQEPATPADQEQHEGRFHRPNGRFVELVAEALNLEYEALVEQLREGATLAEVITANGGDVDAIQAQIAEALVTDRGIDADEAQERAEAVITGDLTNIPQERDNTAFDIVSEALGLDREAISEQLRDGATLAEIISANGGDVDAIQAQIAEALAENRDLDAEEAQERAAAFLNGELRPGEGPRGNGQQGSFGPRNGNGQQGGPRSNGQQGQAPNGQQPPQGQGNN